MPSQIALLICLVFVFFLLRLDHKQSPKASFWLWIPTLWMLVASSRPIAGWLSYNPEAGLESGGNPIDRAFLLILLCLAVLVLSKRKFDWSGAIRDNKWLLILVGFMLISLSWSSMPYVSLKRWTREFIAVIMAFTVLSERNPHHAVISIIRRMSYILIPFSALVIKYYPEFGISFGRWSGERMWIGVATQKNGLARLCIIVAFFLAWTLIRRWQGSDIPVGKYQLYIEILLLILALILMMGENRSVTNSATSLISFMAAMLSLFGICWIKKRGYKFSVIPLRAVFVVIIIYGTITPFVGKLSFLDISSIVNRDATLTERNIIWQRLIPFAMDRPIGGHGYGGFWTSEIRLLTDAHAHNGYLDGILNIGVIGLLLISFYLLSCSQKAKLALASNYEWGALFISYMIMLVIFNIAESSIDSLTSSLSAVVMFFSISSMKSSDQATE